MTQTPGAAPAEPAPVPPAEQATDAPDPGAPAAATALPPDLHLDQLLPRLCRVLDADVGQVLLVEGDTLRVVASHGLPDAAGPVGAVGEGFAGVVAASGAPGAIADTAEVDSLGSVWAELGIRAIVGVPLAGDDRVVGVALVGTRSERAFSSEDISLLSAVANRVAWAAEHGRPLAGEHDDRTSLATVSERLARLDGEHAVTRRLPADTSSPAVARALVVDALVGWELTLLVDTASLLVSELVTNAVRHAGTRLRVSLARIDERRVLIGVADHVPTTRVEARISPDDDEGGRGLFLVEHLSSDWGSVADEGGKTVWFELQA